MMTKFTDRDRELMKKAISLAEKGRGHTSPNPMVGAVIVKDGRIISEGYHRKAGDDHAEIDAIKNSCLPVKGSDMYVSLEPCTVVGRTPPCADELIKKGFKKVIIGAIDPNPQVKGSGIKKLKEAGIEVLSGLFEEEIKKQNEIFFKHMQYKMPFVCAKIASSIDGKLATATSDSKWITCLASRNTVQDLRREYGCVLTGINTIIADDPTLFPKNDTSASEDFNLKHFIDCDNNRFTRVVLDSHLRIPLNSQIVRTACKIKTIVFTGSRSGSKNVSVEKEELLGKASVNIEYSSSKRWDPEKVLKVLYDKYNIISVMIEAGPAVLTSFLRSVLIDKFKIFIAPKIIGGDSCFDMFGKIGADKIKDSIKLEFDSFNKSGDDMLITAYPAKNTGGVKCLPG